MANYASQYNFSIQANTSQAKSALTDLQTSLSKISTMDIGKSVNVSAYKNAAAAAKELSIHLNKAINADTGKLNLNTFCNSLQQAKTSVTDLSARLLEIGPKGATTFTQLATSIATAEVPIKRMNATLASALTTLKNTVKWQLSSSLIHGLMSTLSGAVSYVRDLDESLNNIRIVTGKSNEEMAKFASYANKAAKELSTTTQEYAKAALIYYQQGDNDAMAAKKAAITAKAANVAFTASAKEMSEMLTAVWNSYQVGSDQLEHVVDVMAKLGATTASSMEEMATGMQKVAATANNVGVSMEQMAAMIATSASVTRQAPQTIGTAWNTVLSRLGGLKLGETLEDGVDLNKYSKALKTIGVDILDASGNLREMGTVVDEIGAKWNTLSKAEQSALAQTVGGVRQYTQIMAFFDNFDKYQQNMKTALTADGALQEQADIYADSWEAASKRVKAATQGIYSELINNKAMTSALNTMASFLDTISGLIKGLGGLPGILAIIASSAMQAFGPEIAQSVVNLGNHLKTTFTGAETEQQKFLNWSKSLRAEINEIASQSSVLTEPQKTQVAMLDAISESNTRLLESSRNLSKDQIAHVQSIISAYQEQIDKINELMQKQEEMKEAAATSQTNLTNNILQGEVQHQAHRQGTTYDALNTSQKQALWTKSDTTYISELENGYDILKKMSATLMSVRDESKNITLSGLLKDAGKTLQSFSALQRTNEAITEQYGRFGEQLKASNVPAAQIKADIQDMVTKLGEKTEGTFLSPAVTEAGVLADKLDEVVYKFNGQELKVNWDTVDLSKAGQTATPEMTAKNPQLEQQIAEANAAQEALNEIFTKLNSATGEVNTSNIEALKEALLDLVPPELKGQMQEFIDNNVAAGASIADLAREGTALAERLKNDVSAAVQATNQKIQAITTIASNVTMIVATFRTLSNTVKTLKDPNATAWQKFGAVLSAVGTIAMSTGRIMSMFNNQQLITTLQTTLLSAAQKEGFVSWLLTKLGIKAVGDEAVKTQIKCWPLLIVLGLIAAAAAVIVGVVAAINAISEASERPAKELAEHQQELKQSMADLDEENNKLTQDLRNLNDIMADTSLTYEEQLTKINEICKAYGVQATMLDILSGNYATLEQKMTAAAQASLEGQLHTAETNSTNAAQYAQDAIDVKNNYTTWGKIGLTAGAIGLSALDSIGIGQLISLITGGSGSMAGDMLHEAYRDHGMFENFNSGNKSTNEQEIAALVSLTDELAALGFSVDAATGQINEIEPNLGDGAGLLKLLRENDRTAAFANQPGSYTAGVTAQLTEYGFNTQLQAQEQQRNIALQKELFANSANGGPKFDWMGRSGEATLSETNALVQATSAKNANERATILSYLSGYSNYATTGAQLAAVNTLSQQAAARQIELHPTLDHNTTENMIYEDLNTMLANDEISVETLLKISPTDIVLDEKTGHYTIDAQARKLAEDRIAIETQQTKQAALDENKDLMTGKKFKKGDLTKLVDSGLFTEEEARAFMERSQGEREIIWEQMYEESAAAEEEALERTIEDARARIPELQAAMDEWLADLKNHCQPLLEAGIITADQLQMMTDEELYQFLTNERARIQGIIDSEQGFIDEYYSLMSQDNVSDEQKKAFAKKLGLSEWDDKKVEAIIHGKVATVENSQGQISRIDTATASGDALAASLGNVTQTAEDAEATLSDTKAYNDYTSAVTKATQGAESFTAALNKSGQLSSDILGKLKLLDSAALTNYQTMTSADWNDYVYEKAVAYYDKLIEEYRKVGNEVDALTAEQEKAALRSTYIKTISDNARKIAENDAKAIKELRDAISSSNSILDKLNTSTSINDLSFEQIETLKQKLQDVGYTALEADAIIRNLGQEDMDTEEGILAATRQQVDLLLTDIALLESQKDQYDGLYTVNAEAGENMEEKEDGLHARITPPEPEDVTVGATPDNTTITSDWKLAKTPSASSTIPPFEVSAKLKETNGVGGNATLTYENGVYTLSGTTVDTTGTEATFSAKLGADPTQTAFLSIGETGIVYTGQVTTSDNATLDIQTKIADNSAIKYNPTTKQLEIWGYGENDQGEPVSTLLFTTDFDPQTSKFTIENGELMFQGVDPQTGVKLKIKIDEDNWPVIMRRLQEYEKEAEQTGLTLDIPGVDLFYTWQPTSSSKDPLEDMPEQGSSESNPLVLHYRWARNGERPLNDEEEAAYEKSGGTYIPKDVREAAAAEVAENAAMLASDTSEFRVEAARNRSSGAVSDYASMYRTSVYGFGNSDITPPSSMYQRHNLPGIDWEEVYDNSDNAHAMDYVYEHYTDIVTQGAKAFQAVLNGSLDEGDWAKAFAYWREYMIDQWDSMTPEAQMAGWNLLRALGLGYNGTDIGDFDSRGKEILKDIEVSLEEASPSKATYRMGVNLMAGLNNGWKDSKFDVGPLGEKILQSIEQELSSIDENKIADLFDDVVSYEQWEPGTGQEHFGLTEFGDQFAIDDATLNRNKTLRYMEGSLGLSYEQAVKFGTNGQFSISQEAANANLTTMGLKNSSNISIEVADGGSGYVLKVDGQALSDTIYGTVEEAYTDAVSSLWTEDSQIEWMTSGYRKDLNGVAQGLYATAMQTVLDEYNTQHGTTYDISELIKVEGVDNVLSWIERKLGTSVNNLQKAVELDWAKVRDKWQSGLASCYKLSEEAAQKEYELWEDTFNAIADARKIIWEEGTLGTDLDPEKIADLAVSMLDKDGRFDQAAFNKGIWGGKNNGGYTITDLSLPEYKVDKSGLAQYALYETNGQWSSANTMQDWVARAVAGQTQYYLDHKDQLITDEMRGAATLYAQDPGSFSKEKLMAAYNLDEVDAGILYQNILSYIADGFVEIKDGIADWSNAESHIDVVAARQAQKDVGTTEKKQRENYNAIFRNAMEDWYTYQQAIIKDSESAATSTKNDYDEAVALRDKVAAKEALNEEEMALQRRLIDTYGTLDNACLALATSADQAADATEYLKLALAEGYDISQDTEGKYSLSKAEMGQTYLWDSSLTGQALAEKQAQSYEAALAQVDAVVEKFKEQHPEMTEVTGTVVPIYDASGENIIGYAAQASGSISLDSFAGTHDLGDNASKTAESERMTQRETAISSSGLSTEEFEMKERYAKQRYAGDEGSSAHIDTKQEAQQLQEIVTTEAKAEAAYTNLRKVSKDTWKTLTTDSKKGTSEWIKALNTQKSYMADIFDVDMKDISDEFVENHLDDMKKMATGTEKEAKAAAKAIEDDLIDEVAKNRGIDLDMTVNLDINNDGAVDKLDNVRSMLDEVRNSSEVELHYDTSAAMAGFSELYNTGQMTFEEIQAMLNTIGWEPMIEYEEIPFSQFDSNTQQGYVLGPDFSLVPVTESMNLTDESTVLIPKIGAKKKNTGGSTPRPKSSSGGGGGGSSAKKVESYKKGSDEKERYHEITAKLTEQSNLLTKLDKLKSRTFGAAHVKAINDEIAALDKEAKLYGDLAKEASTELEANKKILTSYGATFNDDGTINYEEYMDKILAQYNKAVDKYNNSDQDAGDELALKKAEEIYNEAKKAMEDYEEDMAKLNEAQENMLEYQNKISAAMLEGIQYKVEVQFDLNDRDVKRLQYLRNSWEDFLDKQDDSFAKMTEEALIYEDNLKILGASFDELNAAYADGTLNQADYAAGMQDLNDKMLEQLENLLTIKKSIKEAYGNTLEMANQELSKYTAILEHSRNVMQSYIQMQQLMGLGADYSGLKEMYQMSLDASNASVAAAKAHLDTLKKSRADIEAQVATYGWTDVLKQQWEDVNNAIIEGEDDLLSKTQQALEDAQAAFTNTMQSIIQDFDQTLFGMKNGLANLEDDYSYYQEEQARYLSTSKELYEVAKLNRQIDQSIADTTTKTSKERLKALQEQIKAQAESTRLTEYDVQMMELQYKHALALQELEDAKNAKSVVRLTRDENGNFGYQYTADDKGISDAQQKVDDALQQINELAANRVAEMEQAAVQAERQYRDSLLEIAQDTTLTLEERQAKMEELTRRHAETMQFNQEQYNNAQTALLTNQQYVYERYGVSIMTNTGMMQDQYNASIADMMAKTEDYAQYLKAQMEPKGAIYEAMQKYKEDMELVTTTSGLGGWASMTASVDDYRAANQAAQAAIKDVEKTLKETLANIDDSTEKWNQHGAVLEAITSRYEALSEAAAQAVRDAAGNIAETEVGGASSGAAQEHAQDEGTGQKHWRYIWGYDHFAGTEAGYDSKRAAEKGAIQDMKQKIYAALEAGETDAETAANKAKLDAIYDKALGTIVTTAYKTGGLIDFTGPAWVDGSHEQPELMLNSTDTRNLLRTVDLVREMDMETLAALYDSINQSAIGMMYAMSGLAAPTGGQSGELKQNVTITADFPNATDRNEISAAFEDLVNLAAQYANR